MFSVVIGQVVSCVWRDCPVAPFSWTTSVVKDPVSGMTFTIEACGFIPKGPGVGEQVTVILLGKPERIAGKVLSTGILGALRQGALVVQATEQPQPELA